MNGSSNLLVLDVTGQVGKHEMGVSHGVGKAFDVYDCLIEFDLVRKSVVCDREGIVG
jgi:hypothetical protein